MNDAENVKPVPCDNLEDGVGRRGGSGGRGTCMPVADSC